MHILSVLFNFGEIYVSRDYYYYYLKNIENEKSLDGWILYDIYVCMYVCMRVLSVLFSF